MGWKIDFAIGIVDDVLVRAAVQKQVLEGALVKRAVEARAAFIRRMDMSDFAEHRPAAADQFVSAFWHPTLIATASEQLLDRGGVGGSGSSVLAMGV